MSAQVVIFPLVARYSFHDPAWREQYERECAARCDALLARPPRTRPILAIDNTRQPHRAFMARAVARVAEEELRDNFDFILSEVVAELERQL